jgi:putative transposase
MWPHGHSRKPSPSDVTDPQWAILEPLIPPSRPQRGGRPREVDKREVLTTIWYQNRRGCQWDMRPHDVLRNSTVDD